MLAIILLAIIIIIVIFITITMTKQNTNEEKLDIPAGGHEEVVTKRIFVTSNPVETADNVRNELIANGWKVKLNCSDNAQLSRQQAKVLFGTTNRFTCEFFENHPEIFLLDRDLTSSMGFSASDLTVTDPVWVNTKLQKLVKGFKNTEDLYEMMGLN